VDLPEPDKPITQKISPRGTVKEQSAIPITQPNSSRTSGLPRFRVLMASSASFALSPNIFQTFSRTARLNKVHTYINMCLYKDERLLQPAINQLGIVFNPLCRKFRWVLFFYNQCVRHGRHHTGVQLHFGQHIGRFGLITF